MKIIIINDSNGHGNAVLYNDANMRKLLEATLEYNDCDTCMDDPDQGRALIDDPSTTAEQIESFMSDYNGPVGRSAGGMIHFVDMKDDWDFSHNPFT